MTEKKIPSELGTRPVGELLRQYALPSIIAMTEKDGIISRTI